MIHPNQGKQWKQILFVLILSLSAFSCMNPLAAGGTGTLTVDYSAPLRTIEPTPAVYKTVSYTVKGSGPNGARFDGGSLTATRFTIDSLAAGDWLVTVQGFNAAGHAVAQADVAVRIFGNETSSVAATLNRQAGDGTLDLSINWNLVQEFDAASGTLTTANGTAEMIFMTLNDTKTGARFTALKPAGDYVLNLNLSRNGTSYGSVVETVRIFKDATSAANLTRNASTYFYTYSSAQPVIPVAFDNLATRTVQISGASGKSVFLVKINQLGTQVAANSTGTAASVLEVQPYSSERTLADPEFASLDEPVQRRPHVEAEAWNAQPPRLTVSEVARGSRSLRAAALTTSTSTKDFWVDRSGTWIKVTAKLYASSPNCFLWMPMAYFDSSSTSSSDLLLNQAQLNALATQFDKLYPLMTSLFGYEVGGGSTGDGGRDGYQQVSILLYDVDFDYTAAQAGGTLGFFWGKDDYPQSVLDAAGVSYQSNYAEMFYLDVHFLDRYPGSMYSTLGHEFQHMIHYNQKSYVTPAVTAAGTPTYSSVWFNEMCSLVAEDLLVNPLGITAEDAPSSRLAEFADHYAEAGVTDWLALPNTLKSYASAYAFGGYLLRNYGGAALFGSMVKSNKVDREAISAALSSQGFAQDSFETALSHYGEALVFAQPPAGSQLKSFNKPGTWTVNGLTYTANALDLAAANTGMRVYDLSAGVALRPTGQLLQSKPAWSNLSGNLSIVLTKPADGVSLYLMVK